MAQPRDVEVPFDRVPGWVERYDRRHPGTTWTADASEVTAQSPDGTTAVLDVPFTPLDERSLPGLYGHLRRDWRIGVVLVRRGGFAVAYVRGSNVAQSKVGRRHVQGRTKAGGQSQQRFARRRENQARAAFDAAADHVRRVLGPHAAQLDMLATGGDRQAISAVLDRRELHRLAVLPRQWLGGLPDPRRDVLNTAVDRVRSVTVHITDPDTDSDL